MPLRFGLVLALLLATVVPVHADERLTGPNGAPAFVIGLNYEGPADRAWEMWQDDKFDAGFVDADFGRAAEAGANSLRIFVQGPLVVDIGAGRWGKLDQVLDLADKHGLRLVISLHDYGERDLGRVSATAGQIAQHYRGRAAILAFDLKNEPRFWDLATTKYAIAVPLQQHGLIDALGERLPRDQVADYRASPDGTKTVPAYLSDDEAYIYVNNLRLYQEMLAQAADWVKAGGFRATTLDYLKDPAGVKWQPLRNALNESLSAWLTPQIQAIHNADPGRLVTADHVDAVLASLPANDALDVQSFHRYPGVGGGAVRAALSLVGTLQKAHPGAPFMLSEFGYATETLDADRSALQETAIWLGLLAQHAAGGSKWMLNDMPPGFNLRERTLGAYTLEGKPKPIVGATGALREYLNATGSAPGDIKIEDDPDVGLRYVYRASDALFAGGKHVDAGAVSFDAAGPAQLFVSWTDAGALKVWASAPMQASVDVGQLLGTGSGDVRKLNLQPGANVLQLAAPQARAADYDVSSGHFFTQTNGHQAGGSGFSVTDVDGIPLWTAFNKLGGVDVLGYPVSRRFAMDGFTVQVFQKAVLQWHPEQSQFDFLNIFDMLHDRGRDAWLSAFRQTPPPLDNKADAGQPWDRVVARDLGLLDKVPGPLKDRFLADPDWLDHYGLPVSTQEYDASIVVRAQRATLQYWKQQMPWADKGSVTVANGGDLAKEAGVFPWLAVTPENAPR
ncbi:MAG: cellulase family glycosylhydrolase [Chloroflexi bacterium]|nr:cellulase family glycosylhydrolase [Chloroflexota bacterium]